MNRKHDVDSKSSFKKEHCETVALTIYPMVGKTVATLQFSLYELGFYHFRMPVTMHNTVIARVKEQERARKRVKEEPWKAASPTA